MLSAPRLSRVVPGRTMMRSGQGGPAALKARRLEGNERGSDPGSGRRGGGIKTTSSHFQGGPEILRISSILFLGGPHWLLLIILAVSIVTKCLPAAITRIRLYTGPCILKKIVAVDSENHRNRLSIRTDFSRFRQIIKTAFKEPFRKRIVYTQNLPESDCRSFS